MAAAVFFVAGAFFLAAAVFFSVGAVFFSANAAFLAAAVFFSAAGFFAEAEVFFVVDAAFLRVAAFFTAGLVCSAAGAASAAFSGTAAVFFGVSGTDAAFSVGTSATGDVSGSAVGTAAAASFKGSAFFRAIMNLPFTIYNDRGHAQCYLEISLAGANRVNPSGRRNAPASLFYIIAMIAPRDKETSDKMEKDWPAGTKDGASAMAAVSRKVAQKGISAFMQPFRCCRGKT